MLQTLKLDSYKELAHKVAFLELPNDIATARSEFDRIANDIKINSKRKKLHELASGFEYENNDKNTNLSESSHDLKQIDNIIMN